MEEDNYVALVITWIGILTGIVLAVIYIQGLLGVVVSVAWYLVCTLVYKNLLKGPEDE